MGPRVWITRAQPGASMTAERLAQLGLTPVVLPLIATTRLETARLPGQPVDAIAFTSAAAVGVTATLTTDRTAPVYAVGDATARAARAAGWLDVVSADGAVSDLARLIMARAPAGATVLHPSAVEVAGDLSGALAVAGVRVLSVPVYATTAVTPSPEELEPVCGANPATGVLIQSPSAAAALSQLLGGDGRLLASTLFALSAACAAPALASRVKEIVIAPFPREQALLKVVTDHLMARPPPATPEGD